MDNSPLALPGLDYSEMESLLVGLGHPRFRARQVYTGIYRRRIASWEGFTELPKVLREELARRFDITPLKVDRVFESRDGTRRYLFEVPPAQRIEAVFIPEERRDTFCISTQVGCAVECLFCVTGRLPMRRNLSSGEIVGQVLALWGDRGTAGKRLNIVIMGMGEPLHNYDCLMKSIRLMTDPEGMSISPRRITLSSSGVVPGLRRLAGEAVVPNLAISLNATTDEVRDILIPINRRWNIAELLRTCREFPLEPRRRITFEYVLIEGINDTPEDARRLVRLLRGMKQKVNLIPLNRDPWIPLNAPSTDRVLAFQKTLADSHMTACIRQPRGDDVSAACGMLAGRERGTGDVDHPPPKPARPDAVARLLEVTRRSRR